jgi:hypothetical protein
MSEFSVTNDKVEHIAKEFGVKGSSVKLVHNVFTEVLGEVKNQYLAHIIRCMETRIRKITGNPLFQINTFPITADSPILSVGCAQYYPKRYFSVFFHPRMEEKQLRVCLAHELGHLFIVELLNNNLPDGSAPFAPKTLTEPLSSVFGVFTIMDKNLFYKECALKFNYHSWEELVRSFVLLRNKIKNDGGPVSKAD